MLYGSFKPLNTALVPTAQWYFFFPSYLQLFHFSAMYLSPMSPLAICFSVLFLGTESLTALINSHTITETERHSVAFNRLAIPCADWHMIFLKEWIFSKIWMVQFRKNWRPNHLSNHKPLSHGVWILVLRTTSEDLWSLLLCSHF